MTASHRAESRSPLLELERLTKLYGDVTAVADLNLVVGEGEFVTLLGPSGSGKSTILALIAGFQLPTSGRIGLRGKDISRLAPGQRDLGVVFQHYALFPHMTVEGNISYPLKLRGWDATRRRQRVRDMLELVRLPGHEGRSPRQLSGGQQQRVALARVLAFEPPLLLMDEPLGALDREIRVELKVEIRRIHKELGITILYVTHDREEALALSDRIAIVRGGHLVAVAPPAELFMDPPSAFVARFFSGYNILPVERFGFADARHAWIRMGDTDVLVRSMVQDSGARVCLALPPHDVQLHPRSGAPLLAAQVVAVVYLGDEVEVTFLIDRGGQMVGRFPYGAPLALQSGERVDLYFSLERAILVRDDMMVGNSG